MNTYGDDRFVPRAHRFCASMGIVLAVVYVAGFVGLAKFLPPPAPDWTPSELVSWLLANDLRLRIGYVLMICGGAVFGIWGAAISVWTRRSESHYPVLYISQVIALGAGVAIFVAVPVFWAAASYRAGQFDPQIIQTLWDLGWFMFLFAVPPFITWAVSLALSIIWNPPESQFYPRWLGYLTLAETVCWTPALVVIFFKNGPFAYHGAVALYLPFGLFFPWVVLVTVMTFRVITRTEARLRAENIDLLYEADDEVAARDIDGELADETLRSVVGAGPRTGSAEIVRD